jgi:acyl dehydratase
MITDELQQFIGKVAPPIIRVVETGAIRRYADAVGNHNPIYSDEEYARGTRYGGIIATPGFFGWAMKPVSASTGLPDIVAELQKALSTAGFSRILDGGISYDFYLPVSTGDTIVASPKVKGITEKEGKSGAMMVCNFETTYINQYGELIAQSYQTFIAR